MSGAGVLLDVTRTISRAGLGAATGIDRVERRWIDAALSGRWGAAWFHARIASGAYDLSAEAMRALLAVLDGAAPPPKRDLRGALSLAKRPLGRAVESELRRRAGAAPAGLAYLNVGHSNLTPARTAALRARGAARVVVLLHDLIPLEYPAFARSDGPAKMQTRLDAAALADAVIYNSADTRARAETRMEAPPPGVVAPLGIDAGPVADAPDHGGFVALGTIEPRKNHELLLGVWANLPTPRPTLHIIGRRGWMNKAVFARLDAKPDGVIEHGPLDDAAARSLLAGARALLFPSFAEGYGLPLGEALAMGVPAVAADLPAMRELGGDAALWLAPHDAEAWTEAVTALARDRGHADLRARAAAWAPPTWDAHFASAEAALA